MVISLDRSDLVFDSYIKKASRHLEAFIVSMDVAFAYGAKSAIQPRAWPTECHLLEKTFGMKLVSVEPPRIQCYVYNGHDPHLHLTSNAKSITDNDYLIPDAGMKVFTFL